MQVKSMREITLNLIEFQLLFNSSDPLSFYSCNFILTCFWFQYSDSLLEQGQKWNT